MPASKQSSLNKIIIGLLVVIIILLVIIFFKRPHSTPSNVINTKPLVNPNMVLGQPPVILETPYFYDNWLDPDWWWGGNGDTTYVNNYYYDNNKPKPPPTPTSAPTLAPAPTLASAPGLPLPDPTLAALAPLPAGVSDPTIGNQSSLPTAQLIFPSMDSIFPLPTLGPIPEEVPIPALQIPPQVESGVDMPFRHLPGQPGSRQQSQMFPDSQAARGDAMASQVLGMRGGNAGMEQAIRGGSAGMEHAMHQVPKEMKMVKQM